MDTRTKECIVLSTVMACVLSAQPVVAQSGNLTGLGASMPSSFGRALSDSEMGNLRGGYLPPGSNVFINFGNEYHSDVQPFVPSSATVGVSVPGTNVTGAAATGASSIIRSIAPPPVFNPIPPSQTVLLTPEQATNHISLTWIGFSGGVSAGRGVWIVTLFRDPDN